MSDALANWQWLTPFPSRDRALVLDVPGELTGGTLARGFLQRHEVPLPPVGADWSGARDAWRSHGDESIDCVAVGNVNVILDSRSEDPLEFFADMLRVLRRPAGVYVGIEHVALGSAGLLATIRGDALRSRQARLLIRAGFSDVRAYYLVTSPSQPRHFIPARRSAVLAWERAMGAVGRSGSARRLLASLGLHSVLHRFRLVTAHR